MNLSVWRDVRSWNGGQSGSGDVIVGLCDGNRIWRVSPDTLCLTAFTPYKPDRNSHFSKLGDSSAPVSCVGVQEPPRPYSC